MADWKEGLHLIPIHMQDGLKLYIENGIATGTFMNAVLNNDLVAAFSWCDDINEANMKNWAKFLYLYMPQEAYGSPAKVEAYKKSKARERSMNNGQENV